MAEELDEFGELLMHDVRDRAIRQWRAILDGTQQGDSARRARELTSSLSGEQRHKLAELLPMIIDTCLHYMLATLEGHDDVQLRVRRQDGTYAGLREASDGLPGELYGKNGWIARFSNDNRPDQ